MTEIPALATSVIRARSTDGYEGKGMSVTFINSTCAAKFFSPMDDLYYEADHGAWRPDFEFKVGSCRHEDTGKASSTGSIVFLIIQSVFLIIALALAYYYKTQRDGFAAAARFVIDDDMRSTAGLLRNQSSRTYPLPDGTLQDVPAAPPQLESAV